MYDTKDIKNYILYLRSECGLSLTLHPYGNESLISLSDLITFNIHDNPYCVYIKTFERAQKHCIERQSKVRQRCREGSFCGKCFAGVSEYVYPISNGHETVGFISVSGYRTENADSFIKKTAEDYVIPEDRLREAYQGLKAEMPPKEYVDTLLRPLCSMLELAYLRTEDGATLEEGQMDKILRYVKRYHTQNITLDDICREFACSRSSISHRFKRSTGKSFREYLCELRIEDAKTLLCYSFLSVTEIALSVGFCDSTYFASVFKRCVGVSPSEYRKRGSK